MTRSSNIIETINEWNVELESFLKDLGEYSAEKSWAHRSCGSHYRCRNFTLIIITVVLDFVIGSGVLSTTADNERILWVSIVLGVLLYCNGLINVIRTALNYEYTASEHEDTANEYSALHFTISSQMALCRSSRQNAKHFLEWIEKSYNRITNHAPCVILLTRLEFKLKYGKYLLRPLNLRVTTPEKHDNSDMVIINVEDITKSQKYDKHQVNYQLERYFANY